MLDFSQYKSLENKNNEADEFDFSGNTARIFLQLSLTSIALAILNIAIFLIFGLPKVGGVFWGIPDYLFTLTSAYLLIRYLKFQKKLKLKGKSIPFLSAVPAYTTFSLMIFLTFSAILIARTINSNFLSVFVY